MTYEIVKKFMYRGMLCIIIKMNFDTETIAGLSKVNKLIKTSGVFHNGYVESSLKCSYHDLERHIERVELTYSGNLDHVSNALNDKWFLGFDTAHYWNRQNPKSQTAKAVEKYLKELCDEIISKGGIQKIYDDNLAEIIAEKL